MAKCQLRIVIDGNKQDYIFGEEIRGIVHVEVDKTTTCKDLIVRRCWKTHGYGNTDTGGGNEESLFQGEWQPGSYQYPFRFRLDDLPLTYHGEYINIDWYIQAQADVPWAFDPRAEEMVFLSYPREHHAAQAKPPTDLESVPVKGTHPAALLFPLIFAIIGTFILINNELIISSIFFVIAALIAFAIMGKRIALKKLGKVEIAVWPKEVCVEESVYVRLAIRPENTVSINRITATLIGKESATSGSGTNKSTRTHTLYEEQVDLTDQDRLFAAERFEQEAAFQLPVDAPLSFDGGDNRISWHLQIHADIPKCPDLKHSETIQVIV